MVIHYTFAGQTDTTLEGLKKRLPNVSLPRPVVNGIGKIDPSVVSLFASKGVALEVVKPKVPVKTLDQAKAEKSAALKDAFRRALENGRLTSSLGFDVNADETALRNLDGLVATMEDDGAATVAFCDFHNRFHDVSLDDVKTLRRDVARHTQALYQKKWALRHAIEQAETVEELDAIDVERF